LLLVIDETKESKEQRFDVALWQNNGGAALSHVTSKECNTFDEVFNYLKNIENENKLNYIDLTLDCNNKKVTNIMDFEDLIISIKKNLKG
jgi:hypothetical protein